MSVTSSGIKSSDGVIYAGPCKLVSVQVIADGTNAATSILYDNATAASGTAVSKLAVDATLVEASFCPPVPIQCNNGLYLDLGGTGCEVIVSFLAG
jgi:hypothetical protein